MSEIAKQILIKWIREQMDKIHEKGNLPDGITLSLNDEKKENQLSNIYKPNRHMRRN